MGLFDTLKKTVLKWKGRSRDDDERFRVGQVWRYKARNQDEDSRVLIGRVEKLPRRGAEFSGELETVIGVVVFGLNIKSDADQGPRLEEISHLPLDRLALDASVEELVSDNEKVPEAFIEGYEKWRHLFDRGLADWYKFPVAQCVELAERTFQTRENQNRETPSQRG